MNEQLKEFADEMILEVKHIIKLTKEELPEVVKEYIRFKQTMALAGSVGFGVLTLVSIIGSFLVTIYGERNPLNSFRNPGELTMDGQATIAFSLFVALFFAGTVLYNLYTYFEFKLQPRRKAIEAVITLFKGA